MAATTGDVAALSRALVEVWNSADWPAYRALAAPDYSYEETAGGRRIDDVDGVLADWRRLRHVFPDVTAVVVDVLAHGDTSVVGLVWRATHSAPVLDPDGVGSSSYKRIRIADWVTLSWRDSRLVAERHHVGFLSVVAAVPALTGGGGRS